MPQRLLAPLPGLISILSLSANAQTDGPLGDLFLATEEGLVHYSSYDTLIKHAGFRVPTPVQTPVLVAREGGAVLRRWWASINFC